jgi:hypothetical protein
MRRATQCLPALLAVTGAVVLWSCASRNFRSPAIDPDAARARITKLIPAKVATRDGWAVDMFAAFEALEIAPSTENACAVIAVAQQESGFQADPTVPGLPGIARREIDARAAKLGVPQLLVSAALHMPSPTGKSYAERLDKVSTERELSEIFEDFIDMVPLGARLFADWNPVRTGGPMQVSIAFAEDHAKRRKYPYPVPQNIRHEVFTRRGGLYFGTAHLLDYPAPYDDMLYRFADYNAGHFASRNAAFQNALAIAATTTLALDGDLLIPGNSLESPSNTELAVRKIASRIDRDARGIRDDLDKGDGDEFERTKTYRRVFELAGELRGKPLPRALVPQIRLQSAKITRKLTTQWFASRVNERYRQCLARGRSGDRKR